MRFVTFEASGWEDDEVGRPPHAVARTANRRIKRIIINFKRIYEYVVCHLGLRRVAIKLSIARGKLAPFLLQMRDLDNLEAIREASSY